MATTISSGELVAAKTICLALKVGSFGNTKQASLAGVQWDVNQGAADDDPSSHQPDKTLLRLSKTLLDSPELTAVKKADRELAVAIRTMAFSSLFKGGVYMLPLAMVPTAEELLKGAIARRAVLVEAACAAYQTRIDETAERLGVTFNAADYPSPERFRACFYLEYSYVTFETPSRLKAVSAALFQAETEKARVRLESVAEECQQTMRAGLLSLVDHLAERLTPSDDGKAKRLSNSTIGNLNDFLATFELRNVTDDAQLGDIVAKARQVMQGLDHKSLKSDDLIRQKVVAELSALTAALDPLIVEKGTRSISFEDE